MNRGEVWWGELPATGRRPFLVVSRTEAIPHLLRVLVAPVTRTIRSAPSELLLDEGDGMPVECVANFDDMTSVSRALLTERICVLRGERLDELCRTIARTTGC